MSKRLEPCPFCRGTDLYVVRARIEEYHTVEPEISCKKCGYTIKLKELAIDINESPETNADWWDRSIAKKWNTRPAEEALKAEVERLKADLDARKSALKIAFHDIKRAGEEIDKWKKMFYDLVDKQAKVSTQNNAPDTEKGGEDEVR